MGWKSRIVLDAREAFLLCRGDDLAIAQQRRRAVVIKGGNAENQHGSTRQRLVNLEPSDSRRWCR